MLFTKAKCADTIVSRTKSMNDGMRLHTQDEIVSRLGRKGNPTFITKDHVLTEIDRQERSGPYELIRVWHVKQL